MIFAADVGGTKTLLGLFERDGEKLRALREGEFASQESPSFEAIVERFLGKDSPPIEAGAVGVAGPISNDRSGIVHLPWHVDAGRVAGALGLDRVALLNDLEASAWGVSQLDEDQVIDLTPDLKPVPGNAALVAAGTGLGMSILFWDGAHLHPSASEGGHQGFAPRDAQEIALLEFLQRRYERVCIERVVSGPGLSAIYEFLVASSGASESDLMKRRRAEGDPNAAITAAALAVEDPIAVRTLDWFVSMFGAAAGDLALVAKAVGGLYVGGGIAPKILPKLRSGEFLVSFRAKGALTQLAEKIPVRVILEPRTALYGAAACAAQEA